MLEVIACSLCSIQCLKIIIYVYEKKVRKFFLILTIHQNNKKKKKTKLPVISDLMWMHLLLKNNSYKRNKNKNTIQSQQSEIISFIWIICSNSHSITAR